jgi:hypothetical protein
MKRRSRFQGNQDPNSKSYREPTRIAGRPMDPRYTNDRNFNFLTDDPRFRGGRPVPPRFDIRARNGMDQNRIRPEDFITGRPGLEGSLKQPGVTFGQALQGKTTQQDNPTVTSEKSKAFGDLLSRMKRF